MSENMIDTNCSF